MQMFNSTIKQKKCKCSDDCDKFPTLGWKGYFSGHATQELKEKQTVRSVANRNRHNLSNLSKKVKTYAEEKNALKTPKNSLKLLLLECDSLFSNYIRDRDADEKNTLTCYCCGKKGLKTDRVDKEDPKSDFLFNCLHFVSRTIYSLRFDDIHNARTGCCYCNEKMHSQPKGKEYQIFRQKLVIEFGEEKVQWMEKQKYVINKLTHSDLESIIEKYKKV